VIPERIIFVSRGITAQSSELADAREVHYAHNFDGYLVTLHSRRSKAMSQHLETFQLPTKPP